MGFTKDDSVVTIVTMRTILEKEFLERARGVTHISQRAEVLEVFHKSAYCWFLVPLKVPNYIRPESGKGIDLLAWKECCHCNRKQTA